MEALIDPAAQDLPPVLLESDRCDATASGVERALVPLRHPQTEQRLQLCASHFQRYAENLLPWIMLVDNRPRVLGGDFS